MDDYLNIVLSKNKMNSLFYTYLNNSINDKKLNKSDKIILFKLYTTLKKVIQNNNTFNIKIFKDYENEIYTVDGVVLQDIVRIKYEFLQICKTKPCNEYLDLYNDLVLECRSLMLAIENNEDMEKIKKIIVKLQILVGREITFYFAGCQLFLDYCYNVSEKNNDLENFKLK